MHIYSSWRIDARYGRRLRHCIPLSALWPLAELAKLAHFPSLPSLSISLHLSPSLSASPSVHIGRRIDRLGEKEIHEIYTYIGARNPGPYDLYYKPLEIGNHWTFKATGIRNPLDLGNLCGLKTAGIFQLIYIYIYIYIYL